MVRPPPKGIAKYTFQDEHESNKALEEFTLKNFLSNTNTKDIARVSSIYSTLTGWVYKMEVNVPALDLYLDYRDIINRLSPGARWMDRQVWEGRIKNNNIDNEENEIDSSENKSEGLELGTLVDSFSIYRAIKDGVKEIPSSQLLAITNNTKYTSAEIDQLKLNKDKIYFDLVELATIRLRDLELRSYKQVILFSKIYEEQHDPNRVFYSSKQVDQRKIVEITKRFKVLDSTNYSRGYPDWVKEGLAKNEYFTIGERTSSKNDQFAAVKAWQICPKSMPKNLAVKIGDMPMWKRMAASKSWKETEK